MIDWELLLAALALMLVVEGVLPFLSPQTLRNVMLHMVGTDDRTLRVSGLISMVVGVVLLYLVH